MTKSEETAWLDRAIAKLGPHTYLGSTLADQRDAIVADISNDATPLCLTSLRQWEVLARNNTREAEKQADEAKARLRGIEAQIEKRAHELRRIESDRTLGIERLRTDAQKAIRQLRDSILYA